MVYLYRNVAQIHGKLCIVSQPFYYVFQTAAARKSLNFVIEFHNNISIYNVYATDMQSSFDKDKAGYCIQYNKWYPNATDKGVLAYKMLVQTGEAETPLNMHRVRFLPWQIWQCLEHMNQIFHE